MKTLYLVAICLLMSSIAYAQAIDENGRTAAQRAAKATVDEPQSILAESAKTASETTIQYHLPPNALNAEIMVFHPSKDEILKTISLPQNEGSIKLSAKEFSVKGIVVGIYADKKLLATQRVQF
jgi:hypothetical protein